MIVELLIFSGRPSPAWRPTQQESAQIFERILREALVPVPPRRNALGYSGITIRDFGAGEGDGRTSEILVCDGVVAITTADGVHCYADMAGLEAHLLKMGRMRGVFPADFESPLQ